MSGEPRTGATVRIEGLTGLSIEEASRRMRDMAMKRNGSELVPISEALGRVTSGDVTAGRDVPAWPKSAMDGYAVRAADLAGASKDSPVTLTVIGEADAGDFWTDDMADDSRMPTAADVDADADRSGTALRIMTGAVIPSGFDAVVRQEDTDYGETEVNVFTSVKPGINVCPVGEECSHGDLLIKSGTEIGRVEIGKLASAGESDVWVVNRPRVAILSTGSELDRPEDVLAPGHVYGSLSYMLSASVASYGCVTVFDECVPDDPGRIRDRLMEAVEAADVVLTTGGVSVGKKDFMHEVLNELDAEMYFYAVDVQPGTPTIGCCIDDVPVLCLSGNPYAALANFDMYFPQIAFALTGCESYLPTVVTAVLDDPYDKTSVHRRLLRAREAGGHVRLVASGHKSSVFGNMSECNCYVDVPGNAHISVGDEVRIIRVRN